MTLPLHHERRWAARLTPLRRPCAYYLLSRLVVIFAALAGNWLVPKFHSLRALTTNGWDGYWYTLIAQHGYPTRIFNENRGSRWAFFPAFPATIRATVAATGLSYGQAELLLSFVLGLTATIAIWLAIREIFGPVVADRSVLLFVFFPASYVLSMAYTEGLFLTAAATCLFCLSRRYWISASLVAVLASLTRSFGLILIVCVVVAAVPVIFKERKARPLVAVMIAPTGFLGWLGYSWIMVGTPFAFMKAEKIWSGSHFVWFIAPFVYPARIVTGLHTLKNGAVVLCTLALVFIWVGMVLWGRARKSGVSIPLFWRVFAIGSVLLTLSPYFADSVLRYSMAIIPLFAAYAWRMRPAWEGPVIGVMAFFQGVLAIVVLVGALHMHTAHLFP